MPVCVSFSVKWGNILYFAGLLDSTASGEKVGVQPPRTGFCLICLLIKKRTNCLGTGLFFLKKSPVQRSEAIPAPSPLLLPPPKAEQPLLSSVGAFIALFIGPVD